jgi:methionine-rich copper-binding protein CopC
MTTQIIKHIAATLLFLLGASLAYAHTQAISTSPKSGSVLEASPPAIVITFKEAASLTSVSLAHVPSKSKRKLTFSPSGSATEFTIDDPRLEAGANVVTWTALSKDGHVVKGTIMLTVKAPAGSG